MFTQSRTTLATVAALITASFGQASSCSRSVERPQEASDLRVDSAPRLNLSQTLEELRAPNLAVELKLAAGTSISAKEGAPPFEDVPRICARLLRLPVYKAESPSASDFLVKIEEGPKGWRALSIRSSAEVVAELREDVLKLDKSTSAEHPGPYHIVVRNAQIQLCEALSKAKPLGPPSMAVEAVENFQPPYARMQALLGQLLEQGLISRIDTLTYRLTKSELSPFTLYPLSSGGCSIGYGQAKPGLPATDSALAELERAVELALAIHSGKSGYFGVRFQGITAQEAPSPDCVDKAVREELELALGSMMRNCSR